MDFLLNGMKLVIGLITFMVVIRLLGKKHLAEMTPYDIIYLIMFGGILEETLYDNKISIWMFLFSIAVWATAIFAIEKLVSMFNPLRILLKGEPDQLISNGKIGWSRGLGGRGIIMQRKYSIANGQRLMVSS